MSAVPIFSFARQLKLRFLRSSFETNLGHPSVIRGLWVMVVASLVLLIGISRPIYNYDLLGYMANALRLSRGLDVESSHFLAFEQLRARLSPAAFKNFDGTAQSLDAQTQTFRSTIHRSPLALEDMRRFFSVRVAYTVALDYLDRLGVNLVVASTCMSAIPAALAVLLIGFGLFPKSAPIIFLPALIFGSGLEAVARMSSPDGLFTLASVFVALLFLRQSKWLLPILVMLPLLRPDSVILSVLLGLGWAWCSRQWVLGIAVAAFSLLVTVGMSHGLSAHGWSRVLLHSFFEMWNDSLLAVPIRPLRDYLAIYGNGVRHALLTPWSIVWSLVIAAFVFPGRHRNDLDQRHHVLLMAAFLFIVLHLIALPLYDTRFFVMMNCFALVCLLKLLTGPDKRFGVNV